MLTMSRRGLLASAAVTAAFGLNKKLAFVNPAHAETPLEPTTGFYKYSGRPERKLTKVPKHSFRTIEGSHDLFDV